ncbi:hypothetical protein TNIN_14791 [Trichonephila inaurata madagascariensis]|uniref:Uncharacterized protein n=1 Tax=Trichonephila inaurata madagascariensis TaxID=2747483 RepID=A0A8X7C4Z3_9ARAC|nr:hypothetical protein TNIN_14791 [Trichonephila inaurata madagascariensis]
MIQCHVLYVPLCDQVQFTRPKPDNYLEIILVSIFAVWVFTMHPTATIELTSVQMASNTGGNFYKLIDSFPCNLASVCAAKYSFTEYE